MKVKFPVKDNIMDKENMFLLPKDCNMKVVFLMESNMEEGN